MSVVVNTIGNMRDKQGKELFDSGVDVFLVLDFDGVLNARADYPFPDEYFGDVNNFNQDVVDAGLLLRFPIRYSKEMIARLNKVLLDERVQICWLTSWRDEAVKPASRMGLLSARSAVVINYPATKLSSQAGKPAGLANFMTDVPPEVGVIWVDDAMHGESDFMASQVSEAMARMTQRFLLIGPDERYGISRDEMAQIEAFVKQSVENPALRDGAESGGE